MDNWSKRQMLDTAVEKSVDIYVSLGALCVRLIPTEKGPTDFVEKDD